MALGKSIKAPSHAVSTYWMIGATQEDFKGRGLEVTLYGFVSEEARHDPSATTADIRVVRFNGEQYEANMDRARIYERITEEVEEFEGATMV